MGKSESRRINPIARVTLFAVSILILFEVMVMGGVVELKAQTVAKYAPWAYEPFLRLFGEHPDSASHWAMVEEVKEPDETVFFDGITLPVLTNETLIATNAVIESIEPLATNAESASVVAPTNVPAAEPDEFMPVG